MAKTVMGAIKKNTENFLDAIPMELLGIESGKSTNQETGEISEFIRVEAEVPKGYGAFSRCQISVKIPDGKMRIENSELEEADFNVIFTNLTISYIDSKNNVYFKAENYQISKDDED